MSLLLELRQFLWALLQNALSQLIEVADEMFDCLNVTSYMEGKKRREIHIPVQRIGV